MGFWSSISNAVSSAASWVSDKVSSAASWISEKASKVWEGAKRIAKETVSWVADKAETFVGTVKKTWDTLKPILQKVRPWIEKAAMVAPWPWLKTSLNVVAKGLEFLEKIDQSPLAKKITRAIEWAMNIAKQIKETFFNKTEKEEAQERQKELDRAMALMKTEEQKQSIRFAQLINDYLLIKTEVERVIEENCVKDFEHFLRLRATQKLLKITEKRLEKATDINQIKDDDLFLIRTGADLVAEDPTLSDENAIRLDKIIRRRFSGKSLIPFVFEELLYSWGIKLENMVAIWENLNKQNAEMILQERKLKTKMKIEGLNSTEEKQLSEISENIRDNKHEMNEQENQNRAMQSYLYAAEGFLQILEKDPEEWEAEGRDWIAEESQEIGMLIIDCAQNNRPWDELSEEQQNLIADYANIFAEDSKARTKEINNDQNLVEVTA